MEIPEKHIIHLVLVWKLSNGERDQRWNCKLFGRFVNVWIERGENATELITETKE